MTTRLVKGTPVVSLADGATLGTVDHVYFDPQCMAVVGFTFRQGGGLLGGGASGLVDISDVHAFGPDAVTVDDISAVRSELAVAVSHGELLDLEELLKRPVMTEGGTLLGHVAAIQFGDQSPSLIELDVVVEGTSEHGHIGASEIQTIGPDVIIVVDRVQTANVRLLEPRRAMRILRARPLSVGEARHESALTAIGA